MLRRRRIPLGEMPRFDKIKKPKGPTGSDAGTEPGSKCQSGEEPQIGEGRPTRPVVTYRQSSGIRHCVVQPSDTLRSIAEREYGDEAEWTRVYQANRDVIAEPDDLASGQELLLP